MFNRRSILALVAAALLAGSASLPAMADKGRGGGDGGGGGGGGGGSGSGGSGSGGGGDDRGGDDGGGNSGRGGGDDNDDDDHSGPGGGGDDDDDDDDEGQRRASDARKHGQASSLRDVLGTVRRRYKGKVVDVKFANRRKNPTYRIKLLDDQGRLITVSVDALTRKILKVGGL